MKRNVSKENGNVVKRKKRERKKESCTNRNFGGTESGTATSRSDEQVTTLLKSFLKETPGDSGVAHPRENEGPKLTKLTDKKRRILPDYVRENDALRWPPS